MACVAHHLTRRYVLGENKLESYQLLPELILVYPDCRAHFISEADRWIDDKGDISAHSFFSVLTSFVEEKFLLGDYEHCEKLFAFVEAAIHSENAGVSNAACTCFIENLINIAGHNNEFELSHFWTLLGPSALYFAESWLAEG